MKPWSSLRVARRGVVEVPLDRPALVAEIERLAAQRGCTRLWLITTNDNDDGAGQAARP